MKRIFSFVLVFMFVLLACSSALAKGISRTEFLNALDRSLTKSLTSNGLLRKTENVSVEGLRDGGYLYTISDPDTEFPAFFCFLTVAQDGETITCCQIIAEDPWSYNMFQPSRLVYSACFFRGAMESMAANLPQEQYEDYLFTCFSYVECALDPEGDYNVSFYPCGDYSYVIDSSAQPIGRTPSDITDAMETWCSVIFYLK